MGPSGRGRVQDVRRRARAIGAAGAVTIALCLALAAPAVATKTFDFRFGSAQPPGEGFLGGEFHNSARGVAINRTGGGGVAAGTVYVVDANNNNSYARIQSFDVEGHFLRAWGKDAIAAGAPGDGGTGFEICDTEAGDAAADCVGSAFGHGSAAGELGSVVGGIAVDQATGDVYVFDLGGGAIGVANRRVQQFDATGHFLRAWGKGVDGSEAGTGFEICSAVSGHECQAGETGAEAGAFGSAPGFAAAGAGIGVDTAGNVYLADIGNKRVQKFDSEGHFLAASAPGLFTASNKPDRLAAVPAGGAFVQGGASEVYRLSGALALEPAFVPPPLGTGAHALALDPAGGSLYTTPSGTTAGQVLYELDPATGTQLAAHADSGSPGFGLALDASGERLYDSQSSSVAVYEEGPALALPAIATASEVGATVAELSGAVYPNGIVPSECTFEYIARAERQANEAAEADPFAGAGEAPCTEPSAGGIGSGTEEVAVHAALAGLTPGTIYDFRLAAANANGRLESAIRALTTTTTVFTEPAGEIGPEGATLNGRVNPAGKPVGGCVFEYGESDLYGETVPCGEYEAEPGVWAALESLSELGEGSSFVNVRAAITALHVGTTYHFRLTALLGGGEEAVRGAGEDEAFSTLGPAIEASWTEGVGERTATLAAEINPRGEETSYRFEYGTAGPCSANPCAATPVPDGFAGEDEEAHLQSVQLTGLLPGVTYHYRVVAGSHCVEAEPARECVNEGPDRSFTAEAPVAPDTDCPNQGYRMGPGVRLPECRAYEMVSPPDKGGGEVLPAGFVFGAGQAAAGGGRLAYVSRTAFGDAPGAHFYSQYLATRGAGGWSTHSLDPPQGTTVFDPVFSTAFDLREHFGVFSADLCLALVEDENLVPLAAGAIAGHTNVYLRRNCGAGADTYTAMTVGGEPIWHSARAFGETDLFTKPLNVSAGGAHAVFQAQVGLNSSPPPSAPGEGEGRGVFDFSDGALHLVSALPGGAADAADSQVGSTHGQVATAGNVVRAVSTNGSRVFWTSELLSGARALYARVDNALTVPVSAAVSSAGALYQTASADGSAVVFLTGGELWRLDVDAALETADPEAPEPAATSKIAARAGGVVGSSEDLSYLYFTSREAIAGSGPNERGEEALDGEWNLYMRHGGASEFVATIDQVDRGGAHRIDSGNSSGVDSTVPDAQVSPDGRFLAFTSVRPLTGYDSTDSAGGKAAAEVFRYDAVSGHLVCASCRPSGERPAQSQLEQGGQVAAFVPDQNLPNYVRRALSDDGSRLFFEAHDQVLPADRNEALDVYEWEAAGSGGAHGCRVSDSDYSPRNEGCLSLISTGAGASDSHFVDASADGGDVFFDTVSSIDPRDSDSGLRDVYDARAEGGFPPPEPAAPECAGDACQPVPAGPQPPSPPSAAAAGDGNLTVGGLARCNRAAQRAGRLRGRAHRLTRRVSRAEGARARVLRSRAHRLARRARARAKQARRCRERAARAERGGTR